MIVVICIHNHEKILVGMSLSPRWIVMPEMTMPEMIVMIFVQMLPGVLACSMSMDGQSVRLTICKVINVFTITRWANC